MKRVSLTFFLALLILTNGVYAANTKIVPPQEGPSFVGYASDRCVVVFKEGISVERNSQALSQIEQQFAVGKFSRQFPGAKASHPVDEPLTRFYKAHFPEGKLDQVMEAYGKLPFVEKVEPIGIYRLTATPNDFHYDDSTGSFPYTQWHYWDSYGVSADLGWDLETGSTDVIVAVTDAGVKYDHFELGGTDPPGPNDNITNGNIWVNDGEIPGNGVDDDNNGYIDDVIGWDFVDGGTLCNDADCYTPDNDPRDGNGHGTHVAGTIGAITNNYADWGVAGIAGGWNDGTPDVNANGAKIMCLRIGYNSVLGGLIGMDYAAEAFYYIATMVDKGYNITAVNCSWGSSSYLEAATNAVLERDVMVVVAAGNANSSSPDYLGSRGDCLDVGGTERSGNPYSGSNYGAWVDIAAPAVDVLSTYTDPGDPTNDYISLMTGTSMACPHVVGVAALLESYAPTLSAAEKTSIITDVNNTKAYNQTKYVGIGIVDARKCLDAAQPCDLDAEFSGAPTSGCAPLMVSFTDASTGTGIDGWDWDFGDGVGTSTAPNPTYNYPTPGTYTVSLTVSSSSQGCSNTETKVAYVTVQGSPVAEFSGAPLTGNAPLLVNFTDLSTGSPDAWSWDFGDGVGTSNLQNPNYTYNDQGDYTVTLIASNACGSDDEIKVNYIHVDEAQPYVQDFANADIPVSGTVSGDYLDTHDSDNTRECITERESGGKPANRYSHLEHKWTINVTGGSSVAFYVEAYRNDNSEGDNFVFAYSTNDVTYTDLVTVASATEQVYSVSMPTSMSGTVYIRVKDTDQSQGNRSLDMVCVDQMYIESATQPVPPVANFSGNPTSGAVPLTVDFTDLSTGNPDTWAWDFGDGVGTSAVQNPVYTYNSIGTYTVSLTVTNPQGSDTETKVDYITVTEVGGSMHVENIVVGRRKAGPNYLGTCTVTIYDNLSNPIADATVYVTATGPTGGNYNGVTGANGTVYFETAGMKKPVGEWCFEVTNVTHATMTYDAGSNVVTKACESGPVFKGISSLSQIMPTEFNLNQNIPNPFNPSTEIGFSLPVASYVTLDVYNLLGQKVAVLADGVYEAGVHSVTWNTTNQASGFYFYRLSAGEFTAQKKMVLLK